MSKVMKNQIIEQGIELKTVSDHALEILDYFPTELSLGQVDNLHVTFVKEAM